MAKIEVHDVVFLTPARVSYSIDGVKHEANVFIDIINRRVFVGTDVLFGRKADEFASEEIFAYLDDINSLPEDFFIASDEDREQAYIAQEQGDQLRQQHTGGEHAAR